MFPGRTSGLWEHLDRKFLLQPDQEQVVHEQPQVPDLHLQLRRKRQTAKKVETDLFILNLIKITILAELCALFLANHSINDVCRVTTSRYQAALSGARD